MTGTKRTDDRRRRAGVVAVLGMLALVTGGLRAHATAEPPGRIERIDLKADGSSTIVFIMLSRPLPFEVHVLDGEAARKNTRRLVLDFENTTLAPEAVPPVGVENSLVQQIRTGKFTVRTARIVLELASTTTHSVDAYETPPHVTIAIAGTTAEAPAAAPTPVPLQHSAFTGLQFGEGSIQTRSTSGHARAASSQGQRAAGAAVVATGVGSPAACLDAAQSHIGDPECESRGQDQLLAPPVIIGARATARPTEAAPAFARGRQSSSASGSPTNARQLFIGSGATACEV